MKFDDKLNTFQKTILIICSIIVIYVIYYKLTYKEVNIKSIEQEYEKQHK